MKELCTDHWASNWYAGRIAGKEQEQTWPGASFTDNNVIIENTCGYRRKGTYRELDTGIHYNIVQYLLVLFLCANKLVRIFSTFGNGLPYSS